MNIVTTRTSYMFKIYVRHFGFNNEHGLENLFHRLQLWTTLTTYALTTQILLHTLYYLTSDSKIYVFLYGVVDKSVG